MTTPTPQGRVLIVDDDAGMRETLADILTSQGLESVTASNGATALQLVREGSIALAVVDQRLPDVTGTDLAEDMKRHDADLPILLLTGYASAETAMAAVGRVDDFTYMH